jgi:hypothetical protein
VQAYPEMSHKKKLHARYIKMVGADCYCAVDALLQVGRTKLNKRTPAVSQQFSWMKYRKRPESPP